MEYLLLYFAVGFSVALVMAHLHRRQSRDNFSTVSFKMMFGAYIFIALAWPISVAAFVYGALSQFILGTQQNDQA